MALTMVSGDVSGKPDRNAAMIRIVIAIALALLVASPVALGWE
jgi:hypothetical protein